MKVIKIIFLMLTLLITNSIFSQTKEQTLQWLDSKLRPLFKDSDFEKEFQVNSQYILKADAIRGTELIKSTKIEFYKIKSITFSEGENAKLINFSGDFILLEKKSDEWVEISKPKLVVLVLKPTASKDEILKIIKALKHLAILNGATLINDDLFND